MAVSDDALLGAIDRIYESVERPALWPETIYVIGEIIGGRRGFWGLHPSTLVDFEPALNKHMIRAGSHAFFLSREDLRTLDKYVDQFGELIVRFLKIVFMSVLWSGNEPAAREAIGLRMVERYLPVFESLATGSVSPPSMPALRKLIMALWEDGSVFTEENLRCMRVVLPHLERALRLQMHVAAAELRTEMASAALDRLTVGVIFVDRSGLPLWLNRRAKEIVNRSNSLRISPGGITGQSQADTRSLRDLVKGAVSDGSQGLAAISRGPDLRPLLLIAVPLKPIESSQGSDQFACGVVFIGDPDQVENPTIEALRQAFRLTYREAQMAIAIAQGHGLQAAADTVGVALTTARSQLQQAFAKTGTSHQAELAALVHRMLAHLRHD